ncbi:uncharacterized protein [Ambystoma mexicanum]|uniref:uncharacterized protein n=1 Tax=Ambystoma mexicanum TaxID=8296 RepID=UPI0037E8A197
MSAGWNPFHVVRNRREEERIRAQLERVQQQFQKDFLEFKDVGPEAPWGCSPEPLTEERPFDQAPVSHFVNTFWASRAPVNGNDVPPTQRTSEGFAKWQESSNIRDVENGATDGRPLKQQNLAFFGKAASRSPTERMCSKGLAGVEFEKVASPSYCRRENKPSITSLAGTIKGVAVCSRPCPPTKPRSHRPASPAQPPDLKPPSMFPPKKRITVVVRTVSSQGGKAQEKRQQIEKDSSSGSDSDESSSTDSGSDDLQKTKRKKRRKRVRMDPTAEKKQSTTQGARPCSLLPVQGANTATPGFAKTKESHAGIHRLEEALSSPRQPLQESHPTASGQPPTSSSHAQLSGLEDAPSSPGLPLQESHPTAPGQPLTSSSHAQLNGLEDAPSSPRLPPQESQPTAPGQPLTSSSHAQLSGLEGAPSGLKLPLRPKARSVDEIIASMRSPGQTQTMSASDVMIQELLESVLEQSPEKQMNERENKNVLRNIEPEPSVEVKQKTGAASLAQASSSSQYQSGEMTCWYAPLLVASSSSQYQSGEMTCGYSPRLVASSSSQYNCVLENGKCGEVCDNSP